MYIQFLVILALKYGSYIGSYFIGVRLGVASSDALELAVSPKLKSNSKGELDGRGETAEAPDTRNAVWSYVRVDQVFGDREQDHGRHHDALGDAQRLFDVCNDSSDAQCVGCCGDGTGGGLSETKGAGAESHAVWLNQVGHAGVASR